LEVTIDREAGEAQSINNSSPCHFVDHRELGSWFPPDGRGHLRAAPALRKTIHLGFVVVRLSRELRAV
jgi:hypothetical protein